MTGWIDVIGWTLVHFVWQGTAIAGVIALMLAALRRAPAQLRYGTACTGLLLCLAAPLLTAFGLATMTAVPTVQTIAGPVVPFRVSADATTPVHTVQATLTPAAPTGQMPLEHRIVRTSLASFVALWVFGVAALTGRLAFGWWRVRALHAESLAAPVSVWLETAQRLAERLRLQRVIHVVDSDRVEAPAVIGWLQPVVLLPVAALANLSPAQVQAILAHELAHIRRHDFLVNLLQTLAETVLFYHPAVWWLSSRIRVEREHCCDDIAVDVCGDPVGYAEALTTLASFAAASPMVVAVTGGSLLDRVRRILRLPLESDPRPARGTLVIAATVLIVVVIGMRLMLVAQTTSAPGPDRAPDRTDRFGPREVNRVLGFDLFPALARYASDDPREARAWDVAVTYPGGEMVFKGFTARGLVRYGFGLDAMPVVDGPGWLDSESMVLRAETSAPDPQDHEFREAIRMALEGQFAVSVRRESRLFAVYGLQLGESGRLGPNIRPSTVECFDSQRDRLDTIGPTLRAYGQRMLPCGVDSTIWGPRGYRVTLAQFARSLRGFGMEPAEPGAPAREVIDQTGLTGVYDFELNLGFLPFAAIATAHPTLGVGFGPMIRTFPQAIDEQLGLRLVPTEEPRDVAVIAAARQSPRARTPQAERELRSARR